MDFLKVCACFEISKRKRVTDIQRERERTENKERNKEVIKVQTYQFVDWSICCATEKPNILSASPWCTRAVSGSTL